MTGFPLMAAVLAGSLGGAEDLRVPAEHPRVMITPALVKEMAAKVRGPMVREYQELLANTEVRWLDAVWPVPGGFMECGLAYLIERELGRDGSAYAEKVRRAWAAPAVAKDWPNAHFGYHGLLYDWIYDALTPEERTRYGQALGRFVKTWYGRSDVYIPRAGWWYNQEWGPTHLSAPHNRCALTSKLLMGLACLGSAGEFDAAAQTYLRSFRQKFMAEGLPALDEMGGIWAESNGHGSYGPLLVAPYSYQAAATGLGIDAFRRSAPQGFAREYIRAAVFTLMPHNERMAWIDDSGSGVPLEQARAAPLFCRAYQDPVARWLSDYALAKGWLRNPYLKRDEVWQRISFLDLGVKPQSPREAGWPLAHHFRGAGHVYMRSAWDDPSATWAFFGAGPSYAAHSRDDEGHFLITRRGQLVTRSGGQGHNDGCYYAGGALIYNLVTIYADEETMRRDAHNENDGGLLRYVYDGPYPKERGRLTAYDHDDRYVTYAAADLTQGYWAGKAREVTRQFVYVRSGGVARAPEFFVIFDRVESTKADYPKTWFLHLPTEPTVTGQAKVEVEGHVVSYDGDAATWLGSPAGDAGLLTQGNARAFLRTLLPAHARITRRGGPGRDFWGHPHNPKAQYNHVLDKDGKEDASYRKPPFAPWRLEVEPTERNTRDYFLHVLTVTDDVDARPVEMERLEDADAAGVRITVGGRLIDLRFAKQQALAAHLAVREAGKVVVERDLGTPGR
jgi:hypothetical protein